MIRFEHDPIPTSYVSNSGGVLTSAPRKNLRVYSFGNVSRHRQLSFQLEVEFKTNLCIGSGIYMDSSTPGEEETGRWYYQYNTQKIPFPVSILPNAVDAARNIRQRGAIEGSADAVMSISLAATTGTASVGAFQAVTGGQTPFARNHFKGSDIGAVKITSLPTLGSLTYRASAVTANMILPSGDLAELKYQPPSGAPSTASTCGPNWRNTAQRPAGGRTPLRLALVEVMAPPAARHSAAAGPWVVTRAASVRWRPRSSAGAARRAGST